MPPKHAAVAVAPPAPTPASAVSAPEPDDSAQPPDTEPIKCPYLISFDDLTYILQGETSMERCLRLQSALHVSHYDTNPRTSVWVDFCFGVLWFAHEEAQFPPEKVLVTLTLTNDLFTFATTTTQADPPSTNDKFPTLEATYDEFRQRVRSLENFSTVNVAQIVKFLSSTFFRHFYAYQHVFQAQRPSITRELEVFVEIPFPPQPLATATLQTE